MTMSCWNKIVRIIASSLTSHKLCLAFILINTGLSLIHIGFHNVVLCYYKIHEIINTKLPTLK